MEDTIISLTPAAFQLAFMSWLSFNAVQRYSRTGHPMDLILALAILVLLPFYLRRLRTAWRNRALSAS